MKRDSQVEQQVLKSLRLDSGISSREICMQSHRGVVTLSGTVSSHGECSAIVHATRRAPGVRGVVNLIEVRGDLNLIPEPSKIAIRSAPSLIEPAYVIRRRITGDLRATDGNSKAHRARRRAAKEAVTG